MSEYYITNKSPLSLLGSRLSPNKRRMDTINLLDMKPFISKTL